MFPFLLFVVGWRAFIRHLIMLTPMLASYGLGLIRNDIAKERVFICFLSGMRLDVLQGKANQFALEGLPQLLRPEAMQRLVWHKQQGHHCVVISASLEIYLRPWAINSGFDDVLATQIETLHSERLTGKLLGSNCFGTEKVKRLEKLLGNRESYTLYAYGDSNGDTELLAYADYPYYRNIPS
ncbi:MAG: HAD-IB family hydrolase [Gallionella sp.]|nr:HAD-IB family hydrolase [Gallionella sp.]